MRKKVYREGKEKDFVYCEQGHDSDKFKMEVRKSRTRRYNYNNKNNEKHS
jgi:hypothetical protein